MKKIKYQIVKIDLLANQSKKIAVNADLLYDRVTGIAVVSANKPNAFDTLGFAVANSEVLPEDFSTLFLDVKNDFLIGDRFFDLASSELPAKGASLDFNAKSNQNNTLWVYLRLEK